MYYSELNDVEVVEGRVVGDVGGGDTRDMTATAEGT